MKVRGSAGTMGFDWIKWLVVIVMLLAGIAANHFYNDVAWSFRVLGWLGLSVVTFAVSLQTTQGKAALEFFRESRIELRKVFWPTRQETLQVTFLVVAAVAVLALVLWGMDGVLVWLMGWLTGQRG